MKKYIFMAVAGMLALSSCSNDDNDVQNAPRQMTFTAGFGDEAQTRATLDGSTKKVSFDAGDAISILSANNTNTNFTTTAGGVHRYGYGRLEVLCRLSLYRRPDSRPQHRHHLWREYSCVPKCRCHINLWLGPGSPHRLCHHHRHEPSVPQCLRPA